MSYSPKDIVQYIENADLVADFLTALMMSRRQFTISEITDARFVHLLDTWRLQSAGYDLNVVIGDEDIVTALHNGLYVSAFLCRFENSLSVHFLVHQYPVSMKEQFAEELAREVVQYLIYKTVLALRLDTPEKVLEYLGM